MKRANGKPLDSHKQKKNLPVRRTSSLQVQQWPIGKVRPYPGNARKNAATIEKVMVSIREFGFQQPIVVDTQGIVVVGHTRLEAARRLKHATVPVVIMKAKASQIAAYRLMDNRSHEDSLWDEELLQHEVEQLLAAGVDAKLTGFEESEIERLVGDIKPADLPDPPESVQANVDRLASVKAQRAKGNAGVIAKSDTEHYLVIVYPDRGSRENAVRRLGLPADERYVDSAAVEIRQRIGGERELKIHAQRATGAAKTNKAGAHG